MLQQRGLDPNLLLSMNNGGFGNNSFIWVLFILLLWNRNGWGNDGWGGNGNHGCIASQLSDVSSRELLMQAIAGDDDSEELIISGDEIKFACVDGPEFDGHLVNFDEAMKRQTLYKTAEGRAFLAAKEGNTHHGGCGNC